jgi:hypothetical protein
MHSIPDTAIQRFLSYIGPPDDRGCTLWTASKNIRGYGYFHVSGSFRKKDTVRDYSHRVSWMLYNNRDIPDGMIVCHSCDNPPCCNGEHLFLGTNKDNTQDMLSKGRWKGGQRGKLRAEDHPVIKELALSRKKRDIATLYGVSEALISMIVNGKHTKDRKPSTEGLIDVSHDTP